jgi:3-oxosteroid 1-dehydrogenase
MTEGDTWDVIVLGSGIAGLAGALAAHEKGLRPMLIEKAPLLGGVTTNSYGLIWVGMNHLAEHAGYADTRDEVIAYMRYIGGGRLSEEKMLAYVDRAPSAIRFFENCGIKFKIARGVPDLYFDKAPGSHAEGRSLEIELISAYELGDWREQVLTADDVPIFVTAEEQIAWGGINRFSSWDQDLVRARKARAMRGRGVGLVCHFLKALRDRRVAILVGRTPTRLEWDGKRVTGVVMESGETLKARKGVVLATGGYYANQEMAEEYEGLPGLVQEPSSLVPESMTGDAILFGAEIGAVVHRVDNSLRPKLAYTIPLDEPGKLPLCVHAGIVELCSPHTLVVNRAGRRFADETFFQGMVPELRRFDAMSHDHPNLPAYLIFDSQYLKRFSFANLPVGSPVPRAVPRDDTLAGLAGKLGVDSVNLQATVSRFNGWARTGVDEDFHRGENKWRLASSKSPTGNSTLGAVEEPPFYGVKLHPTSGNCAGLLTDGVGRVIHQRRYPIAGLYATGLAAAHTEYGVGYQAGISLASAMTFGLTAAEDMAGS